MQVMHGKKQEKQTYEERLMINLLGIFTLHVAVFFSTAGLLP